MCWSIVRSAAPCSPPPYRRGCENSAASATEPAAAAAAPTWGQLYVRGLADGKRNSMQPMAARLGVDHQQLQQFVTSSTWDHVEVRKRVAR